MHTYTHTHATTGVRKRAASRSLTCATLSLMLSACGGGGDGPAVQAQPQTLSIDAVPAMVSGQTATVHASASSGLTVSYLSASPQVCEVSADGALLALRAGTCLLTVSQGGNPHYAPAPAITLRVPIDTDPHQTITFAASPGLSLGGTATVRATATSGLAVQYSSLTPTVCQVAPDGVVVALGLGACTIAADQPGDDRHLAAPQAQTTLSVPVPPGLSSPAAPMGVQVVAADEAGAVSVRAGGTDSGGSPITHYTVRSVPARVLQDVDSLPATVSCGGPCAGLSFTVSASNLLGEGAASSVTPIVTGYTVVATFHEPDTQPRDTVFTGRFQLNATTGEVSALQGSLTESMTGNPGSQVEGYGMALLTLNHQLSVVRDLVRGDLLVTVFLLPTTDTFSTRYGGDGWSPGTGFGLYAGFPSALNPSAGGVGNAYVRIVVDPADPQALLSAAQIDKLAYADCTAGGMMGATCMTGTTEAGYGSVGTMSGYPVSQVIRKLRPGE